MIQRKSVNTKILRLFFTGSMSPLWSVAQLFQAQRSYSRRFIPWVLFRNGLLLTTVKILTVLGARPQFIKAAAVSRILAQYPEFNECIVHTGQHFDAKMSAVFFDELEIPKPTHHLHIGIESAGLGQGAQTGRMLEGLEKVMELEKPDLCLVYGDTNSTLAGALCAAKLGIPIVHIEAGLRSYSRKMPEEINRVLVDHLSACLFTPTEGAVSNLLKEGISKDTIWTVGDVMLDAARFYAAKSESKRDILNQLGLVPQNYILTTIHRAENTNDPKRLFAILSALAEISREIPVIVPLHPRTRKFLNSVDFFGIRSASLRWIEPASYLEMIVLERNAKLIATDSGGVQKEAYFYRVPCVTIRSETEWVELVQTGWNHLCNPDDSAQIVTTIRKQMNTQGTSEALYGEGKASARIVAHLRQWNGIASI